MSRVFAFSEGGGHEVNEDSFAVRAHPDDESCILCVLADGQGGQAGGGRAARVATTTTIEAALGYPPGTLLAPGYWSQVLKQADRAVHADPEAGFTTLVGLAVSSQCICGASSGDSGVLILDDQKRAHELNRQQTKNPPIGSGDAFFVPFAAHLEAGWLVMAMSDGVWKYAGWDRIRDAATRLRGQALVDGIQGFARLRGSGRFQDDFTLIVIQDQD